MGLALSLALPRLMSRRSALIVRSAADSSANWRIEPTTILRCLRLPSGPDSRHLNSQTSGQSLGPRDTSVLHSGSFSTFSVVRPKLLGPTAIVANKRRAGDAG